MAIDVHSHYLPPDLVEALRRRDERPVIRKDGTGREHIEMPVGVVAFSDVYTDMEKRVAFMDMMGVETQLLSLPGLFGIDSLPIGQAAPLVRIFNDHLSEVCRRWPGRFLGLAALPFADTEMAVAELDRSMSKLGLIGAILPVNCFVSAKEADRLHAVLDAGNRRRAYFFVHPGRRADQPVDTPAAPPYPDLPLHRAALRVQTDIASAMITILFTDFLDAYADLTLHIANLGGTFAGVVERMDHMMLVRHPGEPAPSSRIRRVHVDCASLGPGAIELAVRTFGAPNVLLGTDGPIFQADHSIDAVRNARITDREKDGILETNAKVLLRRFL